MQEWSECFPVNDRFHNGVVVPVLHPEKALPGEEQRGAPRRYADGRLRTDVDDSDEPDLDSHDSHGSYVPDFDGINFDDY